MPSPTPLWSTSNIFLKTGDCQVSDYYCFNFTLFFSPFLEAFSLSYETVCHGSLYLTVGRHSVATTPTVGSLPERFSWHPFYARHASPFVPPHVHVSGSLGNPYQTIEALEHPRHHLCSSQRSTMQPLQYGTCFPSIQTDFRPVVSSHINGQPWEPHAAIVSPTLMQCVQQPLTSCCSRQCFTSQPLYSTQCSARPDIANVPKADPQHYDETTHLLANCP